jgi:hypothetical protein
MSQRNSSSCDGSKACLAIRVKDKPGDNAMYVERLLPAAREKLVTIADDAPLMEAANLLHKGTDLVIVCDSAGLVAGVITKSDVVGQMSRCQGASCTMAASLTMTRDVVICQPHECLETNETAAVEEHCRGGQGVAAGGGTSCTRHFTSSSRGI